MRLKREIIKKSVEKSELDLRQKGEKRLTKKKKKKKKK
jgi:hypothetical protein